MSRVFRRRGEAPAAASRWEAIPLVTPILRLPIGGGEMILPRIGTTTEGAVGLLASPGLRVLVNGLPLLGGMKVLDHRDEILAGGEQFVFSEESPPEITSFREGAGQREIRCSLCRGVFREGVAIVRCPGCGRLFHHVDAGPEGAERHCWTYSDRCRHCGHPTAMTGETLWSPEQEERDAGA